MKKLLFLMFLALLLSSIKAKCQENTWSQKAFLPGLGRISFFTFSIGTKSYLGGGTVTFPIPGVGLKDFWEYNTVNNTWTQKADLGGIASGGGVTGASGFSINNKGYYCCGYVYGLNAGSANYSTALYEYDTLNNSWISKSSFIGGGRKDAFCFSIGGNAYLGFGGSPFANNDTYKYNQAANQWTLINSPINFGFLGMFSFVLNGKGYVGGGNTQLLFEFDPTSLSWTQKANLPNITNQSGFSIGNKGYAGANPFYEYIPTLDKWRYRKNYNSMSSNSFSSVATNKGFLTCGYSGSSIKNDLYEYIPCSTYTTGVINTFICQGQSYLFKGMNITTAGTYIDTIYNTIGCDSILTLNLSVKPLPTISISSTTNSICNGDSVQINSISNSSPLSYQWQYNNASITTAISNSIYVKNSGTYKLNVTDSNGCSNTSNNISIVVNPLPTIAANLNVSGSLTFCQGLSVTLSTTSNSTYNYQWKLNGNNIPSALSSIYIANASGNYNVKVANNSTGCSINSNSVTVVVNPVPISTISLNGSDTICANDSVEIISTSVSLGNFQWLRNNSPITNATNSNYFAKLTGSYSLKRTSNNCSSTSSPITITAKSIPVPSLYYYPSNNIAIAYSGLPNNAKYDNYLWYYNSLPTALSTNDTLIPQQNGQYFVRVGYNGCFAYSNIINVNIPTNVNDVIKESITVFPNPADNLIYVSGIKKQYTLELYSVLGQQFEIINENKIDLSSFIPGVYYLIVKNENKESVSKITIVKK